MTPEQFAYWLQGYSEIAGDAPTKEQWQVIQDHLKTVFHKVTPDRGYPLPASPTPPHWPSPFHGPFDSTKVFC